MKKSNFIFPVITMLLSLTITALFLGSSAGAAVVLTVSPGDNQTDVSVSTVITATFSDPMDPESINDNTFYVTTFSDGSTGTIADEIVEGTVSYNESEKKATFDPAPDLTFNESIDNPTPSVPGGDCD